MNRSLKLSILVALTLSSAQALALGLGQIRVKSALNKPLVAEIPLRVDHPGEADQLEVALASADQFARAGLDRMSLHVQLDFKVTTNANGQKVILVTSKQPVRESFLDFLIKVDWPRGQLLREYTVLLDPPFMVSPMRMQGAVAPAKAPASAPAPAPAKTPAPAKPKPPAAETHPLRPAGKTIKKAPAPAPKARPKPAARHAAPAHKAAPRRAPAPAPAPAATPGSKYGPVVYGQTLWGIARRMRSGHVSTNQMMMALKAANPDAFFKNNINALKSGAVLRIPTRDELQATSKAAATAEVLRQDQAWQATRPSRPATMGRAGGGKAPAARPAAPATHAQGSAKTASGNDHLRLVPPTNGGQTTGARAGVANGSNKVVVQKMRDDLARAKEALSSSQQQTADLQARLKSLKSIQDKNDRLMSLKNAEIAELQNKLAAAAKPAAGTSTMTPAGSGSVASAASATGPATAPAMSASKPASASTAATVVTKPLKAVKPKPAVAKPAPRPAPAAPWYTTLWAQVAGGAIVVLGLVLLLLRGRSRKKGASMGSRSSLADQFGTSPLGDTDEGEVDQEQDALLRHLAENPDDIESHLELVSLYYARRDVERFESAAEAMHAHITDANQDEWRDVMMMGEELAPDYPLFADASAHGMGGHEEPQPAWDDHASAGDTSPDAAGEPAPEPASMEDFDFGATPSAVEAPSEDEYDALPPLEQSPAPAPEPAPEPVELEMDDLGGDFSLSSDDETVLSPVAEHDMEDDEPAAGPPAGLGGDAVDTKIDLARAYMDMGDPDGARAMLEEALAEGSEAQRDTAQKLLDELG